MASFIGSNLQTLHYNFKHKIAGSTVENPLKIYSGSVNPSNLPAPTSNEWKEIKNQNFIDRLGQQDGNTVVETTNNSVMGNIVSTNAPCDGMMNVEIGGNTLKNEISKSTVTTAFGGESVTLIKSTNRTVAIPNHVKVNPNLTYSLIINIKNRTNSTQYLGTQILQGSSSKSISGNINATGRYIITFTPIDSSDLGLYLFIASSDNDNAIYEISSDIMILEGDWTNKPIPSYFDGIKSVGELEGNKIEALSCGKNLASINDFTLVKGVNRTIDIKLEHKLLAGKTYTISGLQDTSTATKVGIEFRGSSAALFKNGQATLTLSKDVLRLYCFISSDDPEDSTAIFKNIQLEEGTTATPYEPYKEDKLDILNIVLRGFNNVRDLASGDTITRKIGKRAYQTGDETNTAVLTDKVNTLYVLDSPVIEKLPQPLTLQSFKSGTLQVNTDIPPYIKEWHTTNPDDSGVIQYQSGTTGLSQAFLTQIPLTSITNDIFGGSLPALKSAYKLTSNCDISAYGSGNNNGVETNNISYKVWNGTEYVLLNTNTSNVVSNINNILNNSNYVVDNNIYILMHTLPASDTIKSQINLDYFNANIDIARQPDNVIIPDTVKNTYIPTNYTIFAKVACLKTDKNKIVTQYHIDNNNIIKIQISADNRVYFTKVCNGGVTHLYSDIIDFNEFQVIGVIAQQQNTGMKLSVLLNNGEIKHYSNTNVESFENSIFTWNLGHHAGIGNQLDGFILDYQFTDKTFTNTECEVMLKGRNTTGDITYDSFVKDYQNGKIASGFILPNNKYKVTGQAKLYYNDIYTRTFENCEFVARDDENKVELIGMAELVRVD